MSGFDERYKQAAGFRRASPELRPLVAAVDEALAAGDLPALRLALIAMLELLASERGRTDANCCVIDAFFAGVDASLLRDDFRALVSDLSGALNDAIYAPQIAANFDCLPEQLLERARRLRSES